MLCEGKTVADVGSDLFWKTRFRFLNTTYNISKQQFKAYTINEYQQLFGLRESRQIILWFDSDLFCQINLLGLLSWLKKYHKASDVFLICGDKVNHNKKLFSFTELSKAQITKHYNNKTLLSEEDIAYAAYVWQLYCSKNPLRIETVIKQRQNTTFIYLENALKLHLQRFPSVENGLNNLEQFVLKTVKNGTFSSKKELVLKLLKEQEVFGFGDIQYLNCIQQLTALFSNLNPVILAKKGEEVLNNKIIFLSQLPDKNQYFGGAYKYNFVYNNTTKKLMKNTN